MNMTDSILMGLMAATQAAANNAPVKQPSGTEKDGPSFKDLLDEKRQPTQETGKGDTKPTDAPVQEQPEEPQLPGVNQQELAATLIAQNIVILPQAQQTTEQAPVPVVEAVLPQAEAGPAVPSAAQTDVAVEPEPLQQTDTTLKPQEQTVTGDGKTETAAPEYSESVQRAPAAQRQENDADRPLNTAVKQEAENVQTSVGEAQAQPLFQNVEHTPVKVGDAQTIDTQAPDMDAKLTAKLDRALEQGERRVEIRLTPENLGTVVVELTQSSDGALHVVLRASNDKAANLLSEHAANLGSLLQNGGQNTVQVEVQRQQESQQSQQQRYQDAQQQGGGHGQERQQQERQQRDTTQDFLQQLRLGLVSLDA